VRLAFPPVLLLAAILALLVTQVAAVLSPRRPPYLVKLSVSCAAFLAGEAAAALGVGAGVAVGDLHPLHDFGLAIAGQVLAARWAARRV